MCASKVLFNMSQDAYMMTTRAVEDHVAPILKIG